MKEEESKENDEDEESGHEFFDWIVTNHQEPTDEIADIIKDDLWSNPYQVKIKII